ncbi:Uncharacterised protein [uncultured archaeon]|nr:Uncharacterised protein [uncultured archaeon]
MINSIKNIRSIDEFISDIGHKLCFSTNNAGALL